MDATIDPEALAGLTTVAAMMWLAAFYVALSTPRLRDRPEVLVGWVAAAPVAFPVTFLAALVMSLWGRLWREVCRREKTRRGG